jgi:hypothetical protein
MTSERRRNANRANAQASTGPKTAAGKARTAQNAFRHGLAVPIYTDPRSARKIDVWAHRIAGTDANPEVVDAAQRIVAAELDLRRAKSCRVGLINRALADPNYIGRLAERRQLKASMRWMNLKGRGLLTGIPDWAEAMGALPLTGPEKQARIVCDLVSELSAVDRYERRARSRRKRAVRDFDEACKVANRPAS